MSTEIYYFTSTGNSLVVARELAARTDGTLTSIPSAMGAERIRSDADAIGIVFPVYYASLGGSGLPRIVERFVAKLEDVGTQYVFAVCTHSGGPGDTIENLERIVRAKGGELAAGFGLRTGVPYGAGDKIRYALLHQELTMDRAADDETRQALFSACTPKLDALGRQVRARGKGMVEKRGSVARAIGEPWLRFQKQLAIARYQMLSGSTGASLEEMIPLVPGSARWEISTWSTIGPRGSTTARPATRAFSGAPAKRFAVRSSNTKRGTTIQTSTWPPCSK